jgi:hypothetical protein
MLSGARLPPLIVNPFMPASDSMPSMQRRRIGRLRGAMHNFLETFTSRYSSYNGYWLFGYLVADLRFLHIDLLDDLPAMSQGPVEVAAVLARHRFREQVERSGRIHGILSAVLVLEREQPCERTVGPYRRQGHTVRLTVRACIGATNVESTARIFVSPHDRSMESQSVGRDDRARL